MSHKIIISIIFLLSLILRLWNISSYPVSLSMDEAAIGFNAFSILKTGRDEFGEFLPLTFKSAGDYKPPINVYLTVPSLAIFGMNELGIRFPVVLLGSLTVVVFYFFLKSLDLNSKSSLFGSFWLAVLPWHIHFSRSSFEAVTALFFLMLGSLLFIRFTKENSKIFALLSAVSLSLSVWSYHAERLFVPLLVIFLFILFKPKKNLIIFGLTVLLFAIPFVKLAIFTPAIKERASSTSILREQSLSSQLHFNGYYDNRERLFDNNIYLIFRHWLGKYTNYFDLRFWFWKGMQFTPPGYPDLGLLMLVDLPIFILGLLAIIKSKNKNLKSILLFWFFAGPLPASLTMNEQHPLRALTWIPFFGIVIASGFEYLIKITKTKIVFVLYFIFLIFNFIFYYDIYTNQFPRHFSEYWQYGYKEAAIFACNKLDEYDEIVITDTFGSFGPLNTGLPYLYVLVYCDQDRASYINYSKHLDKIRFRRTRIEDYEDKSVKRLIIGSPWDFVGKMSGKGEIINKIYFKNGLEAFWMVKNNE